MHLPLKACSADAIKDPQRCSLDAVQYDHEMGNVQDLTGEAIYLAQGVAVQEHLLWITQGNSVPSAAGRSPS